MAASSGSFAEETVVFDPARSTVEFTLGDVLHTVHGSFKLKSGAVSFDPVVGKASGALIVDATSGDSGSGARDRRMHKNILESGRYPEIVFTPDRIQGKVMLDGASQIQVHGLFRIHGGQHEMTLPFQVQAEAGQVTATTRFPIPYVKWGMKNPSTFLLKVSDTVDIGIRAVGRLSTEAH
jgi:polyisoprenoid-binding protein YceI